jgi:hypothetical protein
MLSAHPSKMESRSEEPSGSASAACSWSGSETGWALLSAAGGDGDLDGDFALSPILVPCSKVLGSRKVDPVSFCLQASKELGVLGLTSGVPG